MGALAAGIALGPDARRMDIGKVHAPLLPPYRHHIRADEGQQTVAVAGLPLAEQNAGLVDAIDRPVGWELAADEASEGREEIHDRERRVGAGIRLDLAGPADEAERPYR